jgi:glycyl-tRNA synthetase
MDNIVSLAKRRGFIYPSSEVYGGLANAYDYGPLGAELIHKRKDMVGLDSSIIVHPQTWVASGHVGGFSDPVVEDTVTQKRYRADHVIEQFIAGNDTFSDLVVEDLSIDEMGAFIKKHAIQSEAGNPLTAPKAFDLLMETKLGSIVGEKNTAYMRGETAQGIFLNFKNILDTTRVKLPFGVGQIGKSFRNEVTLGQYIFRTFEFEQAEIEYFFDPEQSDWKELFTVWQDTMWNFVTKTLDIQKSKLRWREHTNKERSHYSKHTFDLDYEFPFGWKELWGISYRTDYDLKQHMMHSGVDIQYTDPYTQKKFIPHVIEPAVGINRLLFMVLCDAYIEEEGRTVLKLPYSLAPYKRAVFPLVANKPDIMKKAQEVFDMLSIDQHTYWDDRGNIGKRYKYQDEIGTPYCVTIDYQTLEDNTVTVRSRDSMEQERVPIHDTLKYMSR